MPKQTNHGFMAKLLFVMSAFCFVWPVGVLMQGGFSRGSRSSMGTGVIVSPETDPFRFWSSVAGVLVLGVLLLWWGMTYWRKHQRSAVRRPSKPKKRRRRR